MTDYLVAKNFNTHNRRLKIGTHVNESDDLRPFAFEERRKAGFIKPAGPASSTASPTKTPPVTPASEPAT